MDPREHVELLLDFRDGRPGKPLAEADQADAAVRIVLGLAEQVGEWAFYIAAVLLVLAGWWLVPATERACRPMLFRYRKAAAGL